MTACVLHLEHWLHSSPVHETRCMHEHFPYFRNVTLWKFSSALFMITFAKPLTRHCAGKSLNMRWSQRRPLPQRHCSTPFTHELLRTLDGVITTNTGPRWFIAEKSPMLTCIRTYIHLEVPETCIFSSRVLR